MSLSLVTPCTTGKTGHTMNPGTKASFDDGTDRRHQPGIKKGDLSGWPLTRLYTTYLTRSFNYI